MCLILALNATELQQEMGELMGAAYFVPGRCPQFLNHAHQMVVKHSLLKIYH